MACVLRKKLKTRRSPNRRTKGKRKNNKKSLGHRYGGTKKRAKAKKNAPKVKNLVSKQRAPKSALPEWLLAVPLDADKMPDERIFKRRAGQVCGPSRLAGESALEAEAQLWRDIWRRSTQDPQHLLYSNTDDSPFHRIGPGSFRIASPSYYR